METADIYLDGLKVCGGVAFVRTPITGEYVSYLNQWHLVTRVLHNWNNLTNQPYLCICIDPIVAGPSFVAGSPPK